MFLFTTFSGKKALERIDLGLNKEGQRVGVCRTTFGVIEVPLLRSHSTVGINRDHVQPHHLPSSGSAP